MSVYLNHVFIMSCKGESIELIAVKWMELINNTVFFLVISTSFIPKEQIT